MLLSGGHASVRLSWANRISRGLCTPGVIFRSRVSFLQKSCAIAEMVCNRVRCETPQSCHCKGDSWDPPVSPSTQDLLCMAVRAHVFWSVRRALNRNRGEVRYQKTRSTWRK